METGLNQEHRMKYSAAIRKLPSSPARNVLIDVMTMVDKTKTLVEFESMMNKLWTVTDWVLHERYPNPLKHPEYIHETTAICNAMRMMIRDAILVVLNNSLPEHDEDLNVNKAAYLFVDRMIMKTFDMYEVHNNALKENDELTIDCRNITETYITCVSALLSLYTQYKSEMASKRIDIYKLIAKFAVRSYETSWTVISDEIDSCLNNITRLKYLDIKYPDDVVPQMPITKTNDPESVVTFITSQGYPEWVARDSFRNRIEHTLCLNHSAIIPEVCRVWLKKSPAIQSMILVPDKQSSDLYTICRHGDGIYVLFIDPDTFQGDDKHYIISGMELVDTDEPNPPPRRKLRLTVPTTEKYRYVQDDI